MHKNLDTNMNRHTLAHMFVHTFVVGLYSPDVFLHLSLLIFIGSHLFVEICFFGYFCSYLFIQICFFILVSPFLS